MSLVVGGPLHLRATVLPEGRIRDVFVTDGRFTFHEQERARTVVDGGYLLPGLVDVHAHLSLHSPAGDAAAPRARVLASARAQLAAGVLALREPGSPDGESRGLGPHEDCPRTFTAGALLCAPGRYFPGLGREVTADLLGDAAEQEARASGAWVKIIADFFDDTGEITPSFPPDALGEAAARAHAAGARITAHATCRAAIDAVIDAGFDSIEHATMMTVDHLEKVAARGIALVPTLIIRDGILRAAAHFGGSTAVQALRNVLDAQPGIVRAAAERGIAVYAGTDAGMVAHGLVATEVELLVAAGMSPDAALAAASWQARHFLGLPGITEGAPADVVAYASDPRQDPAALAHPRLIMLDGRPRTPAAV